MIAVTIVWRVVKVTAVTTVTTVTTVTAVTTVRRMVAAFAAVLIRAVLAVTQCKRTETYRFIIELKIVSLFKKIR